MLTPHNMSHVTFHISHVMCQMSHIFFLSCKDYWWRVYYQQGLPRLVFFISAVTMTRDRWTTIFRCSVNISSCVLPIIRRECFDWPGYTFYVKFIRWILNKTSNPHLEKLNPLPDCCTSAVSNTNLNFAQVKFAT